MSLKEGRGVITTISSGKAFLRLQGGMFAALNVCSLACTSFSRKTERACSYMHHTESQKVPFSIKILPCASKKKPSK